MPQTAPKAIERLRQIWREGGTALGLFLFTRLDPVALEAATGLGFDYVVIDMQHGLMDFDATIGMLGALAGGEAVPLVRVPGNDPVIIGRVLDAGALGVIVPMVNSAAEAARAVAACRYAPEGSRSFGPLRARILHGRDYAAQANRSLLCIPMIETEAAIHCAEEIVAVPGVDAVYVGPSDLSLSFGMAPLLDHGEPFAGALARVVRAASARGVIPGVHASAALAGARRAAGFRMITVSTDLDALLGGLAADLGRGREAGQGAALDPLGPAAPDPRGESYPP